MASFENMIRTVPTRGSTSRRTSRVRQDSTLNLAQIIPALTVENQQTDIARRAQDQLNYAENGAPGYTAADIERLQTMADSPLPDWVPSWSHGVIGMAGRAAQVLDRPAQAARFALSDALNAFDVDIDPATGEQRGFFDAGSLQFTLDDYWDALSGNYEELARDNPGIGMDDGDYSFKDMVETGIEFGDSTLRWEQTGEGWNKWGRSAALLFAEALWDPINLFTGGLSGMGKKAAMEIAQVGLKRASIDVLQSMVKVGDDVLTMTADDLLIAGRKVGHQHLTQLERRIFESIQDRARTARTAGSTVDVGQLLEDAAGWTPGFKVAQDGARTFVPVSEIADMSAKGSDQWGTFNSAVRGTADDIAEGLVTERKLSWFGELNQEISRTIANKTFHSSNPLWKDWIDHAERVGLVDPKQSLLVTTGGITVGLPFGKGAARQAAIPGVTALTRGKVSQLTRPLKSTLGGSYLDNFAFGVSTKFNTKAHSMRLARIANEITPGQPVDVNIGSYALWAETADAATLLDTVKPHIGGAAIVRNSTDDITKKVRKELKRLGITKRKGGKEVEQKIISEMYDATFSGRTPDFSNVGADISDALIADMNEVVTKAQLVMKPAEKFVAKFVPELAEAIAQGRPYTPLRMSTPGGLLMRELSGSVADGTTAPVLNALVVEMRRVNRLVPGSNDYVRALHDVVESLNVKARRTGILDEGDRLSVEDVQAFFHMVEESTPSQMLIGKQMGEAAPFKIRQVGNNGMWVFDLEDGLSAKTIFEDPEMMNRKMSSLLYALTEDSAKGASLQAHKVRKYRKLAADRLFDTDIANGLNYWFDSTMEAVFDRVRAGTMLANGAMSRGMYTFDYGAYARHAATSGQADTTVQLRMALQRALDALLQRVDIEHANPNNLDEIYGFADDVILPPNPVARHTSPNEVGMTLDAFLFEDEAFRSFVDDADQIADIIWESGPVPQQWETRIQDLLAEGWDYPEAEQWVITTQLTGFKEAMYGLNESMKAHMQRKYTSMLDVAEGGDDVAAATILNNNLKREIAEATAELARYEAEFLDTFTAAKVSPATVNLTGENMAELVDAASEIVKAGGTAFRTRQVEMLKRQINSMEDGFDADLLRAEIEMFEEVERLVSRSDVGPIIGDLELSFISGGADGVDTMSLLYADKRKSFRAQATDGAPVQHDIGSTGGNVPHGDNRFTSEQYETGAGLASDQADLEALGLKQLPDGSYGGKKNTQHPARTMRNVDDADATIVYYPGVGGSRQGFISGGSADTVYYAMHGVYPESRNGRKVTFSDSMLRQKFNMVAEGVWVPKQPELMHKPIMVVGYVARDHVRPDLVGPQHSAVQVWLHTQATDGKLKLNMAGPRAEVNERNLYRLDEVGNMMTELDPESAMIKIQGAVDNGTYAEFAEWVLSDPLVRARYTEAMQVLTADLSPEKLAEELTDIQHRALAAGLVDMSKPLNIPAMLQPSHPEYIRMRYGELRDPNGLEIRPQTELVNGVYPAQTVDQFVTAFNQYLSWLNTESPFRFGGGNWVTVEDVIRYNVDSVQHGQARYHRNLARITKMRDTDGALDKVIKSLEKEGVPPNRMEQALRYADKMGEDPVEALTQLSVTYIEAQDKFIVDVDGRLKGMMIGTQQVRVGGSIGQGPEALTMSPSVKAVAVNEKNVRMMKELAEKYGITISVGRADRPDVDIWNDLRLFKLENRGSMSEEIPVPFDLVETPGHLVGPPRQWAVDANGELLGPVTGTAGELKVSPVRGYSLREQAVIKAVAQEMRIPNRQKMEINELIAVLQQNGWIPPTWIEEAPRWVDELGKELSTWEQAFTSEYPTGVQRELSGRSGVPLPDGGDRVDVYSNGVPAAEVVFQDVMQVVFDKGVAVRGEEILTSVFGMDHEILMRYRAIGAKTADEIDAERLNQLDLINTAEDAGRLSKRDASQARRVIIEVAGDELAHSQSQDIQRIIYDVMQAYLEGRGFYEGEIDSVVEVLMGRYGAVGTRQDIPTVGSVSTARTGDGIEASLDDLDSLYDDLSEGGFSTSSLDRAELFARLGHNPEFEGAEIGEMLYDGRVLDDAEVMYAQAIINPDTLFFAPDAHIRMPPVDRMKKKKYYSTDYEAGRYADLTRRNTRDLSEQGGYRTSRRPVFEDGGLGPDGVPLPRKPRLNEDGSQMFEEFREWVPGYGSKRQVVQGVPDPVETVDRFSRDLDVRDPTVEGGLGPEQVGGGEPQTQAISFGPDIEPELLNQREVLDEGSGFVEKVGQGTSPPAGRAPHGRIGLQNTVERLMDMIITPQPGASADMLVYDTAVQAYSKAYFLQMNTLLNVVGGTRNMQRLSSMMNVDVGRAREAWRLFQDSGDPDYLFDVDLLKTQALARLTLNGGSAAKRGSINPSVVPDLINLQKDLASGQLPGELFSSGTFAPALIKEVTEFVVAAQKATASSIRDKFGISLGKANKVLEVIAANGIVGPKRKGRSRQVLLTVNDSVAPSTSSIPLSEAQRTKLMALFPDMGSVPESMQPTKLNNAIGIIQARIAASEQVIKAATADRAPKQFRYELSTKNTDGFGSLFSAHNARVKGRGNKLIEELYLVDYKGYDTWAQGRGKAPKPGTANAGDTKAQSAAAYDQLWREWAAENPGLMRQLQAKVDEGAILVDTAGRGGGVADQAESLKRILAEGPPAGVAGATTAVRSRTQPSGTVFVGRGSPYGNPFTLPGANSAFVGQRHPFLTDADGVPLLYVVVDTVSDAVAEYRVAVWNTMQADPKFATRVSQLAGKTLWYPGPAFTADELSHAKVLAQAADWLQTPAGGELLGKSAPVSTSPTPTPSPITGDGGNIIGQSVDDLLGAPPVAKPPPTEVVQATIPADSAFRHPDAIVADYKAQVAANTDLRARATEVARDWDEALRNGDHAGSVIYEKELAEMGVLDDGSLDAAIEGTGIIGLENEDAFLIELEDALPAEMFPPVKFASFLSNRRIVEQYLEDGLMPVYQKPGSLREPAPGQIVNDLEAVLPGEPAPPTEGKVVGQTLDDFIGDGEVRELLDEAPEYAAPVAGEAVDVSAEQARLVQRKEHLRFLQSIKTDDAVRRGTRPTVDLTMKGQIDAIHPGGVPLADMPSYTARLIDSRFPKRNNPNPPAVDALSKGGVWVGDGIPLWDEQMRRLVIRNGSSWIAGKPQGAYLNSLFANPYRQVGRKATKAHVHPMFTAIDPNTGGSTPIPFQQVGTHLEATSKYHDMLWDWILQSESNAAVIRDLHGRTLVDVTTEVQSLPSHINVLSEAADWLYRGMYGRPQNVYARPTTLSKAQDLVVEEALEVEKLNRSFFERIMEATERASTVVNEIEVYRTADFAQPGAEIVDTALIGKDPIRQRSRMAILTAAAQRIHGPDVFVSRHSKFIEATAGDVGAGRYDYYLRMRMPGDDVAAAANISVTPKAFTDMVDKYVKGELTGDDLALKGLDMVVQAGDITKKLTELHETISKRIVTDKVDVKAAAKIGADAEATLNDFNTMLNLVWRAISQGKPKALRRFIGITDDLTIDATTEWQRIEKLLASNALSPDEEQLVRFWVEAAVSSSWDWDSQTNWMRSWQNMRAPHDGPISSPKARQRVRAETYDAAVDAATDLDDKAAVQAGMPEKLGITEKQHRRAVRFLESAMLNMEQLTNLIRTADDSTGYVTPNLEGVRLDPRRTPERQIQGSAGSGYVYTPGKAGNHQSYAELMVSVYSDLDELMTEGYAGLSSLVDFTMELGDDVWGDVFSDTDMRMLKEMHEQMSHAYDTSQPWWTLDPTYQGMESTDSFGLAGMFSNHFINPLIGHEMMAADRRLAALSSQRGMHMVVTLTQRLDAWWKRAATLAKPTFAARNMMGGAWNNLMIGVGPIRHLQMAPDVYRFLRARRKAQLSGWDPKAGTGDIFEDMVIGAVSEKNQAMFRQASQLGLFETTFAASVGHVIPKERKFNKGNPLSSDFVGYRVGGAAMSGVEGLLRMSAFSKYFDPAYPMLSGQLGLTMSNLVHFDYSATTATEDRIKHFVPFWVWSRNNIPLQLRMLMQQPRYVNTYEKSRRYWNETAIEDDDDLAPYLRDAGWVVPWMRRENEEGWAQMMFRPDLPFGDLMELPLFSGRELVSVGGVTLPFGNDAYNWTSWAKWGTDMMGPLGQLGVNLTDEERRASRPGYTGEVAPVGINAIANIVGYGTPTPQGDRTIPKYVSETAMTLFPFWYEYADLAGVAANSPYRLANQGILPGEETLSSPQKGALVSGSRIASGLGFRWLAPKDVFFLDRELEDYLDNLNRNRKIQMSGVDGE